MTRCVEADDRGARLLVRPAKASDESPIGHWLRAAHFNGIKPAWLPVPAGAPSHGRLRLCPICLEEPAARWQKAWQGDTPWCTRHRVWLVDECAACGHGIRPLSARLTMCQCRAPWAATHARPVPDVVLAADAAGVPVAVVKWFGALCRYGLQDRPLRRASRQGVFEQQDLIERGAAIVQAWPESFDELLGRLAGERRTGGLLNAVWPGLMAKARAIADLTWRSAVLRAIEDHVSASRSSGSPVMGRNAPRHPSKREVARRLGIGFARLNRLVAGDPVGQPTPAQRGRRRHLVLAAEEARLRDALQSGMSITAAGAELGMSIGRLRRLIAGAWLQSLGGGVSRASVAGLARSLLDAAAAPASTSETVALPLVLRYRVPLLRTADFVSAALAGEIRLARPTGAARIDEISVECSSIDRWSFEHAGESATPSALSLTQVAQRLAVKDEVISHLLRIGLLHAEVWLSGRRRCRVVTEEALAAFESRYVTLAALAQQAGIGSRGAVSWASSQGLCLVTGPGVDGSRQYIVDLTVGHTGRELASRSAPVGSASKTSRRGGAT
jgi:hypothetical protein